MAVISSSDIVAFAAREGNDFIRSQLNMKAPLFAALDKVPMKGKRAIINVNAGGLTSTTMVSDFGALPSEDASTPVQGFVDAVGYVSVLGLGRIALATLAGVEDSVDLLDTQLQTVAGDMSRQIGTALFGSILATGGTGAAAFAANTATVQFAAASAANNGASQFRVGQAYIWVDVSVANTSYLLRCSAVTYTGDASVDVTFVNDVAGINTAVHIVNALTVAVGDTFHLRGSVVVNGSTASAALIPAATAAVSLNDIVGSTTLHGINPASTAVDWTGNDITGGVPTAELMQRGSMRIFRRSGDMPTHLIMSPSAFVVYCQAQLTPVTSTATLFGTAGIVGQTRKNLDGKLDKYGRNADPSASGVEFMGRPVLIDPNCPELAAYLINKDWVKVGEWQKMQAEDEGGSPLLLSRTSFSKSVQYSAIYNLVCRKRNAHARINSLVVL